MTVMITGANRGIGQGLLNGYAARGPVIGTARDPEGPNMVTLDVTSPAQCADLAKVAGADAVDLLICNAGVFLDKGQSLDDGYASEMWGQSFATNVTGVFLCIQAMLPHLRRNGGKVAIISSQMASSTTAPGGALIYRASKAAVLNLGRNLSTMLKDDGVAVGIYHPGWVRTDMGGGTADIAVDEAVTGLMDRFDQLSLATTGCFETWDGRSHPY